VDTYTQLALLFICGLGSIYLLMIGWVTVMLIKDIKDGKKVPLWRILGVIVGTIGTVYLLLRQIVRLF